MRNRFDSYFGHYFVLTIELLTHINILIYTFSPLLRDKSIRTAVEGCIRTLEVDILSEYYPCIVVISSFIFWNLFCLLQLRDAFSYKSFAFLSLYMEKFVIGSFETYLCLLLFHAKVTVARINTEIMEEINQRETDDQRIYNYLWRARKGGGTLSSERLRKKHLTVFTIIEELNKSYGVGNLVLTIRERFSLAFCLYFWITRNHLFDLLLASVKLFKVGMIFYCFQMLKNEETKLRSMVNELLSHYLNSEERRKFEIFNKQVHALEMKFDACGLFSMDFDTVISIFITTAGYLLLLNQLRL